MRPSQICSPSTIDTLKASLVELARCAECRASCVLPLGDPSESSDGQAGLHNNYSAIPEFAIRVVSRFHANTFEGASSILASDDIVTMVHTF